MLRHVPRGLAKNNCNMLNNFDKSKLRNTYGSYMTEHEGVLSFFVGDEEIIIELSDEKYREGLPDTLERVPVTYKANGRIIEEIF